MAESFDPRDPEVIERHERQATRRMGRRSSRALLTPAVHAAIGEAKRAGVSHITAAIFAGVRPKTFEGWITKGRKDLEDDVDSPYSALVEMLEERDAELEVMIIGNVVKASTKDHPHAYKAGIELAKRKWPHTWSETRRLEIGGEGGGPIKIQIGMAAMPEGSAGGRAIEERGKGFRLIDAPALPMPEPRVRTVEPEPEPVPVRRRRMVKTAPARHDGGDVQDHEDGQAQDGQDEGDRP